MNPDVAAPQAPQPVVYTSSVTAAVPAPAKKGNKFTIVLILLILFLLIIGGGTGLTAAIAYEKVAINNPEIQEIASKMVFSIPFVPKTPKFLLSSAALAFEKITKVGYNVSFSGQSNALAFISGLPKLEGEVKGQMDMSNLKDVKQVMTVTLNPDLNIELRVVENKYYLKLNKIPQLLLNYLGVDKKNAEELTSKWVYGDIPQSFNSEASKNLEEHKKENDVKQSKEYIEKIGAILTSDKILNSLVIDQDTIDGFPSYKMSLKATPEIIDYLDGAFREISQGARTLKTEGGKLSESLENLDIEIIIDKEQYYLRKLSMYLKIKTPKLEDRIPSNLQVLGTDTQKALGDEFFVSFVVKFTDFNKPFEVKIPDDTIKMEEFMKLMVSQSSLYNDDLLSAADGEALIEVVMIKKALDDCFVVKQKYPKTLLQLTSDYCPKSEKDTVLKKITASPVYKYSTNTFQTTFILKTILPSGKECIATEETSIDQVCNSKKSSEDL